MVKPARNSSGLGWPRREVAIGVAAAALFALTLYLREQPKSAEQVAPPAVASEESRSADLLQFQKELSAAQLHNSGSDGQLPLTELELRAGVVKRVANIDGERLLLNFFLIPDSACMVGDIDLIEQDLRHAAKPRILLTVESLGAPTAGPDAVPLQAHSITPEQLVTGANVRLALPLTSGAQQVGLFICLDASGTGTCRDKPPMNFEQQIVEYGKVDGELAAAGKKPSETAALEKRYADLAADKIYYFSFLSLTKEALLALPPQIAPERYPAVAELTELNRSSAPNFNSALVVDTIKKLNGTVSSVPLDISSEGLRLKLPRFSRKACADRPVDPAAAAAKPSVE